MNEGPRAVFLSYASQDAEAAKRICDALRAAGVEVWFDQNELVGGDAWDAKIRKQIKECALLIPIISANTQARTEGYFRLEWRLADQRTHLMAKGRAFLLPVVIDATRDTEAHVPDSFTEVQWTKLPNGEGGAAFAARVKKLLSPEVESTNRTPVAEQRHPGERRGEITAAPTTRRLGLWLLLGVSAVAALGLFIARPWERSARSGAAEAGQPTAPISEARKLAHQAMQLLEDPNFTRETSWLADELCERALKLDAGDAEIWAVAALASVNLYWNTYDTSAARREKISSQAARAVQLDPKSVRAGLAAARSLDLNYESQEALRLLRELHQRAPDDQHVIFHLVRAEATQRNEAAVQELVRKLRALPRTGMLPLTLWFWELRLRYEGRFAEAEAIVDEMLASPEQLRGAYYEKLNLLLGSWHDLAEAERFIETIPARYRREPAFGSAISQYWLWRRQPEKSLQALSLVPQDYFEEYAADEPKALLTGFAHSLAGRSAAAKAEWRHALALVENRLKTDSRNFTLLDHRACLLAVLGESHAAREAWQLRVELGGEQDRANSFDEAKIFLALGDTERAIVGVVEAWPKLSIGDKARWLPLLRHHPLADGWRGDARIQKILTEGTALLQRLKAEQTGTSGRASTDAAMTAIPRPDDKSVAVLAFANLSDDKANEYFSDGVSEELLNVLAKVPGLKVSARTSAFHFKGKNTPIPEIAKQLGVAYVVEGSVRKAGDKVRITAQLIKAADGFHVWSETFTRDLKDVFAVQDEIAGRVAKELSLKLGVSKGALLTVNPLAFELYTQARQAWNQRNLAGYERAEELLNRALELEPAFARAHAALADVWILRAQAEGKIGTFGQRDSPEFGRLRTQVDRALSLDPELAEAHTALGMLHLSQARFEEATLALRQAIALNPNYANAHHFLGRVLQCDGRFGEAKEALARAVSLDPFAPRILDNYAMILEYEGRSAEALAIIERALALQPDSPSVLIYKAQILLSLGRASEALALVNRDPQQMRFFAGRAVGVLARAGHRDEAERLLAGIPPGDSFWALAAIGRPKDALAVMDRAKTTTTGFALTFIDPIFDSVRDDPRYLAFLAELSLTEAHARAQAWRAANRRNER